MVLTFRHRSWNIVPNCRYRFSIIDIDFRFQHPDPATRNSLVFEPVSRHYRVIIIHQTLPASWPYEYKPVLQH
jgi:hypothetical protein